MGFEVTFSYFDSDGNGDYNKEEPKSRTIKVGSALEEVPVEKLAATIMKQFSRPEIWIDNVEVYEYVKKPVKFKEAPNGGVFLAGKKYNLGLNEMMKWAVDDQVSESQPVQQEFQQQEMQQQPQYQPNHQQPQYDQQQYTQQGRKVWPHERMNQRQPNYQQQQSPLPQRSYAQSPNDAYHLQEESRPSFSNKVSQAGLQYAQRAEICDPPRELQGDLRSLNLTLGRQYQIMDEVLSPNNRDFLYKIVNDNGKEAYVGWHYFRQPQRVREETSFYDAYGNLQTVEKYVDQASSDQYSNEPRLLYGESHSYREPMRRQQGAGQNSEIDQMMARMDEAIRRRTK